MRKTRASNCAPLKELINQKRASSVEVIRKQVQPVSLHTRHLVEEGAASERSHRQVEEKQKRIEFLKKKVQTKDEVLFA